MSDSLKVLLEELSGALDAFEGDPMDPLVAMAAVMEGAIRNLDSRCAVCGKLMAVPEYVVDVFIPGASTARYELSVCADCAKLAEANIQAGRR